MSKEEPAAATATADTKEEKPEVGTMKRGDYMIHVFIESAKQLKMTKEGETVDPIVEVSCMNEKKFTTAKDDIGAAGVVGWQEHIFFEPRNVSVDQIEAAKISIKMLDKGFFKDAMIGMYEFDVAYIYFMKQHLLLHKWVALSNPSSPDFNEVTGYLKLSISVAATGDEQVQITEDQGTGGDEESVLMPPSIKPEYYQLKFRFFKAEKLPIMDAAIFGKGGSIDAYLICNYMNQKLKTKVVTMKNDVLYWFQEFWIPVQLPIMSGRLVMKLFDEDQLKDEIVGSIIFSLKECINKKNGLFFWKNIYGAPIDRSGDNTDKMNNNPDLGSTWKGRILMQVVAEKTDKPMIKCVDMDEKTRDICTPYTNPHDFEIIAEIGLGIALPEAKKYNVKIKIADFEVKTEKPAFAENTFNRWNQRFPKTVYSVSYQDIYDMGRVYVYLMDGDTPISFTSLEISEFMEPNAQLKWLELQPDLAVGKVKEPHKAGIVSIKLAIHDKTKNGPIDFQQFDSWKKPPPKRPKNYKVRAYVFQCRDLPAADSDGQSDPYICIWDTSKTVQQTRFIEDNVNPLYYETIELVYEANQVEELPPFVLDIYDKDFNPLDSDDFICRAIIPIKDAAAAVEKDEIPRPNWHFCRLKSGAPECGEVLISFAIVSDDFNFKTPLKYMNLMDTVKFDEYNIEINILGLRDLQSVGILPVKKAFIQFNLKSLVPPDLGQAIENIKTQPGPAGANPTINTCIRFTLPLPGDPLYCPKLQCSVYDNIFKSFLQPLLGVFTIPIGQILHQNQSQRQHDMETLEFILSELQKIMEEQGAITYNIQTSINEIEDVSFKSTIKKQKEMIEQTLNKDKKVEEKKELQNTLMRPLLNFDSDDSNKSLNKLKSGEGEDPKSQGRTPRKTPRSIMGGSGNDGKSKKGAAAISTGLAFFDKRQDKVALIAERKEEEERRKREETQQREKELEEMKRAGSNPYKNILKPQYKLDELLNVQREINKPPDSLYIGLGFDNEPGDNKRHYRRYYDDELENVKDLMGEPPFICYDLKRGQTRGAGKGWWPFSGNKEDESGATSTEQVVGKFKCLIDIVSESEKKEFEEFKAQKLHDLKVKLNSLSLRKRGKPLDFNFDKLDSAEGRMKFRLEMENLGVAHLKITKQLSNMQTGETLKRLLLGKNKCIVRLYVVSAYDLSSRDNGSDSDPYLNIVLGNKVYNERAIYQEDEPCPDFYAVYDFEAYFPGCPLLNIQVYDYDDLFGDDLIGETKVDLEDRFFSPEWQSIKDKPIEYRQLYHQSSSISQGVVKLWVDIIPTSIANEVEKYDIAKRPPEQFEVRVCVFDTEEIKMMDAEGTSDVFIRTFFDSRECTKETDTHFRCQTGKASFNYRLLFDFSYPRKKNDYTLQIQAYDRDFFKSNDIIGEGKINLQQAFEDVMLTKRPISLNKQYYSKILKEQNPKLEMNFKDDSTFWIQLTTIDSNGKVEKTGKVRLQVDVYPKAMAENNRVGEARQEPNCNPFLPPPIGRLSFSLNPLKMFQQLVGPAMRRKIYCYCCLIALLALCIMCLPMILSNLLVSIVF